MASCVFLLLVRLEILRPLSRIGALVAQVGEALVLVFDVGSQCAGRSRRKLTHVARVGYAHVLVLLVLL